MSPADNISEPSTIMCGPDLGRRRSELTVIAPNRLIRFFPGLSGSPQPPPLPAITGHLELPDNSRVFGRDISNETAKQHLLDKLTGRLPQLPYTSNFKQ